MTSEIANSIQPIEKLITQRMMIVIAAYAVLVLAGSRKWLRPREIAGIGAALIFWAAAWLFEAVVQAVRARYMREAQYVGISLALVVPILIAMGLGLRFVTKRASEEPPAANTERP